MANFLVFQSDENGHYATTSGDIRVQDAAPVAGEEMPYNAIAIVWVPVDGCVNVSHYTRVGNYALRHNVSHD